MSSLVARSSGRQEGKKILASHSTAMSKQRVLLLVFLVLVVVVFECVKMVGLATGSVH